MYGSCDDYYKRMTFLNNLSKEEKELRLKSREEIKQKIKKDKEEQNNDISN